MVRHWQKMTEKILSYPILKEPYFEMLNFNFWATEGNVFFDILNICVLNIVSLYWPFLGTPKSQIDYNKKNHDHFASNPITREKIRTFWNLVTREKKIVKNRRKKNICRTSFLLSAGPRNKQFFLDGLMEFPLFDLSSIIWKRKTQIFLKLKITIDLHNVVQIQDGRHYSITKM